MEEEFTYREQKVELDVTESKKRAFSYQTSDPRFNVDFTFACTFDSVDCIKRPGSSEPHIIKKTKLPRMQTVVHITNRRRRHWCDNKARETIARELQNWPIRADRLRRLTEFAVNKAREMVGRMPPHHNQVCLHFPIKVENRNVFDEDRAIRLATQRSIEDDTAVKMVPAAEWSIKSLLKVKDCGKDCCVCLEEVLEGSWMPCRHVFHEDCIKEWLRTSHVCPVCRFEMPAWNLTKDQVKEYLDNL